MVIMVPILGLLFAQLAGLIVISVGVMLIIILLLALIDVGMIYLGVRIFQRETILTRWK